jgi:hypothetical protein
MTSTKSQKMEDRSLFTFMENSQQPTNSSPFLLEHNPLFLLILLMLAQIPDLSPKTSSGLQFLMNGSTLNMISQISKSKILVSKPFAHSETAIMNMLQPQVKSQL